MSLSSRLLLVSLILTSQHGLANSLDDFHVYAFRGINYGHHLGVHGSDIQGVIGSSGDINLRHMAIGESAEVSDATIISGGKIEIQKSAVYQGGLESRDGVEVSHSSIRGSVRTGGSFRGQDGSMSGKIIAADSIRQNRWSSRGREKRSYQPSTDHLGVYQEMTQRSSRLARLQSQSVERAPENILVCKAKENVAQTVCSLDASAFDQLAEIIFEGEPDQSFVLNVSGQEVFLGGKPGVKMPMGSKVTFINPRSGREYFPQHPARSLTWNMMDARSIHLDRIALPGTLLAPYAHVASTQDVRVIGSVYVSELSGNGQINRRLWEEPAGLKTDPGKGKDPGKGGLLAPPSSHK